MFHLDNSSGVDTMPTVANKQSDTTKWFTEGDNVNPPSYPGQDWFNIMQAECLNILKVANITPKKTQLNQLSTAIQQIVNNAKASSATTTAAGIVQLSSAVNSEAENQAATPKAVKIAYDLANAALPKAGGTVINELISTSLNALRFKNSTEDISSLIRFDGVRLWFLFTNKGDAYGNFNSMRPMSIHATTGAIDIGTALTIKDIPALKVGDGGLLSAGQLLTNLDDANFVSGFYITTSSTSGVFPTAETTKEGSCILVKRSNGKGSQLYLSSVTNKIYFRGFQDAIFSAWQELITTANLHEHEKKDIVLKSIQTFTSSGTYTPTDGVKYIEVFMVGASTSYYAATNNPSRDGIRGRIMMFRHDNPQKMDVTIASGGNNKVIYPTKLGTVASTGQLNINTWLNYGIQRSVTVSNEIIPEGIIFKQDISTDGTVTPNVTEYMSYGRGCTHFSDGSILNKGSLNGFVMIKEYK